MNLLFLTSRLPYPPNRGDKVRTFFFLKELSKMHNIVLFSYIESDKERNYQNELQIYCKNVILIHKSKLQHLSQFLKGFFNRLPFQVNYYNFSSTKKRIQAIMQEYEIDLIYTHLIRMAPAVEGIACKKILDYTDAISMEYNRSLPHRTKIISKLFYKIEAKRTRKYEQKIIDYFDEGWFISSEDIHYLNFGKNKKIIIVPNPVNIFECKTDYQRKGRLIFVGNMSVAHNISAVKFITYEIMPKLLKKTDVQFTIVGADPVTEVLDLNDINNTKVLGFVDDLYKELTESDIFIAPMFFSAGIQNKVLEAMAVGLPVITTSNVVKSIIATDVLNIIGCDTKCEFIESSLELLDNETKRENIGKAAYQHMKSTFSIDKIRKILKENTI